MRERSTLPPLPANIDPDPAEEHIERLEAECDRYRAKSERRNTLYMEQRARAISAEAEGDCYREALQDIIRASRDDGMAAMIQWMRGRAIAALTETTGQ